MRSLTGALAAIGVLALLATACGAQPVYAAGNPVAPRQDANKSMPPSFKSTWKMDLPAGTKRIAVADVTEDKQPRLLVLDADGTLIVQKLSDTAADKEGSVALGADAAKFVVGHFTKDKPAVIVVPGAVYYRDGDKYSKKDAPDLKEVTGSVRFKDGTENVFTLGPGGPPKSYAVDLTADKPLAPGRDMPDPGSGASEYREIVVNFPPEFFEHESFPDEVKKGSIVRLFDPRGEGKLYGLMAWQAADGPYIAVVDGSALFPQPKKDLTPTWKSPKLAGKVLDIELGADPKGSKKTGIFVLQETGEDGKGRAVEFFALE